MTILIAFFMMAFLAAIIFTVVGYTKHQPVLALFGAAFFLIVGGIAYAQSVSQWDVWYDLMFVAFIFGGLIAMVAFSLDRTERKDGQQRYKCTFCSSSSLLRHDTLPCPYCSGSMTKKGHTNDGRQRWECSACSKSTIQQLIKTAENPCTLVLGSFKATE